MSEEIKALVEGVVYIVAFVPIFIIVLTLLFGKK